MKRLVIGDIHGCLEELHELIDKAALASGDEIISAGDFVDRGPDTPGVLDFFKNRPNARAIMGNHERKHVGWRQGQIKPSVSQMISRRQIGEAAYREAVSFMDSLPRFFEFPEAIVVHAFFEPGVPLENQRENVIVGTMTGERYLDQRCAGPWYERYDGPKPLIVGHRDYLGTGRPLVYQDRVYGIDTNCCRGGALTGIVLPDFRIVSVQSRKNHWAEVKNTFRPEDEFESSVTWKEAQAGARRELMERAEEALRRLFERVMREHDSVVRELRRGPYDSLSESEQGRAFAARIGSSPLARQLHMARKGRLTPQTLRECFDGPAQVLRLVSKIGRP